MATYLGLCTVAVLVGIIECQSLGPPGCTPPTVPTVEPLLTPNSTDRYPREEVAKILKKDASLRRAYHNVRRQNRYCSRGIPVEGPGDRGDGSSIPPMFSTTCPSSTRYYRVPSKVWYGRVKQFCWVLPPWRNTFCSYATCRLRFCRFVNAKPGPEDNLSIGPPRPQCIQSRWERIYYFVICQNPSWQLYQRFIELPRICSCDILVCPK